MIEKDRVRPEGLTGGAELVVAVIGGFAVSRWAVTMAGGAWLAAVLR